MTGFVDAVVPDPPIQHALEVAAKEFLADPKGNAGARERLMAFFEATGGSVPKVQAMMAEAPRLQVMRERSEQLAVLARIGQQAVQFLGEGKSAPSGWKQESLAQIQAAKGPSAIVVFDFLEPLGELVNAVR